MEIAVKAPRWVLIYAGKDISQDIIPYVLQITYTDALSGESDDLEIQLEDRDGYWSTGWFPQKGDQVQLYIGYAGEPLINCGTFQVDEVELNGPPDIVNLRALSAGVTQSLRTKNTKAYENKTLDQIAREVAGAHGLTLVGDVSAEKRKRRPKRITQKEEGDLAFLRRIGEAEGVIFSVKGTKLVWHDMEILDAAAVITTIKKSPNVTRYSFRTKTNQVYKACEVSYFDPVKKSLIKYTYDAPGVKTGDTLKLNERCESKADAIIKAKAALRNTNGRQVEGSITLPGAPRLAAGSNIETSGFGIVDGPYQITKARHSIFRGGGYSTDIDISTSTAQNKSLSK